MNTLCKPQPGRRQVTTNMATVTRKHQTISRLPRSGSVGMGRSREEREEGHSWDAIRETRPARCQWWLHQKKSAIYQSTGYFYPTCGRDWDRAWTITCTDHLMNRPSHGAQTNSCTNHTSSIVHRSIYIHCTDSISTRECQFSGQHFKDFCWQCCLLSVAAKSKRERR